MPRYGRRRYRRNRKPRIPVGGIGFPQERIVRMRYFEEVAVQPAGLANQGHATFRLNSIFDPNYSVGGHNPIGYDEWFLFYNSYLVMWTDWHISFQLYTNTGATNSMVVGAFPSNTTTFPGSSVQSAVENGRGSYRILQVLGTNSDSQKSIRGSWAAKDWFNVSDLRDNWGEIGAAWDTNPTEEAYLFVYSGTSNGTAPATQPGISATVTLDYYVLLSDLTNLIS